MGRHRRKSAKKGLLCNVCHVSYSSSSTIIPRCCPCSITAQHALCDACLHQYIFLILSKDITSKITCPAQGCYTILSQNTIQSALAGFGYQNLWNDYVLRSNWHGTSEQWIKQFAVKCPGCNVPIEKNGGCDHMMCKRCHLHFNWHQAKHFHIAYRARLWWRTSIPRIATFLCISLTMVLMQPYGGAPMGGGFAPQFSGAFPPQGFGQFPNNGGFFGGGGGAAPFPPNPFSNFSPPPPQPMPGQFGQGFGFPPAPPAGFGFQQPPFGAQFPPGQPQFGAQFPPAQPPFGAQFPPGQPPFGAQFPPGPPPFGPPLNPGQQPPYGNQNYFRGGNYGQPRSRHSSRHRSRNRRHRSSSSSSDTDDDHRHHRRGSPHRARNNPYANVPPFPNGPPLPQHGGSPIIPPRQPAW